MGGHEALRCGDHGRETAFHVRRAARVQHAVLDHRLERIGAPFFAWPGRHDIGMAGEAEHRAAFPAARPQVLHRAEAQAFDLEAQRFEPLADQIDAAVVLGADRGAPQQVLRQGKGR